MITISCLRVRFLLVSGLHGYPFELLGDTVARFVGQLLMGMSDFVVWVVGWGRRARPSPDKIDTEVYRGFS